MISTPASVELARRDDVARILEISNWAALHTTANFATQPESLEAWLRAWDETERMHPWLVARASDGQIIGFAKSSPHHGRCAYEWTADVAVYVDAANHGRGVGHALYRSLIPVLRAQGYATLIAGITGGNSASETLHQRHGFARCGTLHRVGWKAGRWLDVGYWELLLDAGSQPPAALRPVREVWPLPR